MPMLFLPCPTVFGHSVWYLTHIHLQKDLVVLRVNRLSYCWHIHCWLMLASVPPTFKRRPIFSSCLTCNYFNWLSGVWRCLWALTIRPPIELVNQENPVDFPIQLGYPTIYDYLRTPPFHLHPGSLKRDLWNVFHGNRLKQVALGLLISLILAITLVFCASVHFRRRLWPFFSGSLDVERVDVVLHITKLQNTKSKLLMTVQRKTSFY